MEWIKPVKTEIELFPDTLDTIEELSREAGVSKAEIIDRAFTIRIPLDAGRAVALIIDDVSLRTQNLNDEDKQIVYLNIIKYLYDKLDIK